MVEVLKQKNGAPLPVEQQVVVLYAAQAKLFAEVAIPRVREAEGKWLTFVDATASEILTAIKTSGKIEDETKKKFAEAMDAFRSAHKELFTA